MIRGAVTADREPIVRIVVRDASGQDDPHNAVVDTDHNDPSGRSRCGTLDRHAAIAGLPNRH